MRVPTRDTMSSAEDTRTADASGDLRTMALISYGLYFAAFFNGLTAIVGLVLAYVKRSDARGTAYESHFDNLITVFWVGLVAMVVITCAIWFGVMGALLAADKINPETSLLWIPVALVAYLLVTIWYFYRTISGFVRALDSRPYK